MISPNGGNGDTSAPGTSSGPPNQGRLAIPETMRCGADPEVIERDAFFEDPLGEPLGLFIGDVACLAKHQATHVRAHLGHPQISANSSAERLD